MPSEVKLSLRFPGISFSPENFLDFIVDFGHIRGVRENNHLAPSARLPVFPHRGSPVFVPRPKPARRGIFSSRTEKLIFVNFFRILPMEGGWADTKHLFHSKL